MRPQQAPKESTTTNTGYPTRYVNALPVPVAELAGWIREDFAGPILERRLGAMPVS